MRFYGANDKLPVLLEAVISKMTTDFDVNISEETFEPVLRRVKSYDLSKSKHYHSDGSMCNAEDSGLPVRSIRSS